ncbi:uncharacterized protein KY384_005182 [Bacidia gigantensis]|uniref:uncharacterized protein n=1 Tax=Bacidia gigantensis TaxID=2732470 RepID=UPI001D03ACDD|nr:uncharacterized protein KY384_005182 [Bacidia gigantensis]KAG8529701.1 hypothetical protein KY384_005182 [Bacidia gigantensis]
MSRIRVSIQKLEAEYNLANRKPLENLITAWRGIRSLPPEDPNSFFAIAGFHGEPFHGPGVKDDKWSFPGCQDVTIPFLDELWTVKNPKDNPVPLVLTNPHFAIAGKGDTSNPLCSYALQKGLKEKVTGADNRYTNPEGYETVRYPLSGLVGTDKDKADTLKHNSIYASSATEKLNANVKEWLLGTVKLADDGNPETQPADTYSIVERFQTCLRAPKYTVFTNMASQKQAIEDAGGDPLKDHFIQSLESPHNAIHLALGGFYQEGSYNANPILGANGDMGDNETTAFDPIFFLHHAFIDLMFWKWQKKWKKTAWDSLDVIEFYPGTVVVEGSTGYPPGTLLTMNSPLYPFKNSKGGYYTPNDMVDIVNQLDYKYEEDELKGLEAAAEPEIIGLAKLSKINRAKSEGSFSVLSHNNIGGCANYQNFLDIKSYTPIDEALLKKFNGGDRNVTVTYSAAIQTRDGKLLTPPGEKGDDLPEDTVPNVEFQYWKTDIAKHTDSWDSFEEQKNT